MPTFMPMRPIFVMDASWIGSRDVRDESWMDYGPKKYRVSASCKTTTRVSSRMR